MVDKIDIYRSANLLLKQQGDASAITDLHAAWQSDPERYVGYNRSKQTFLRRGSYWDHRSRYRRGRAWPEIKEEIEQYTQALLSAPGP